MRPPYRYDVSYRRGHGRQRGYDEAFRRRTGYGREVAPFGGRYFAPLPGERGFPSARWGWNPISWTMLAEDRAGGYDLEEFYEPPRRAPRASPTYGRRGDEALRQWSRSYGYDFQYAIRPHTHRQENS